MMVSLAWDYQKPKPESPYKSHNWLQRQQDLFLKRENIETAVPGLQKQVWCITSDRQEQKIWQESYVTWGKKKKRKTGVENI